MQIDLLRKGFERIPMYRTARSQNVFAGRNLDASHIFSLGVHPRYFQTKPFNFICLSLAQREMGCAPCVPHGDQDRSCWSLRTDHKMRFIWVDDNGFSCITPRSVGCRRCWLDFAYSWKDWQTWSVVRKEFGLVGAGRCYNELCIMLQSRRFLEVYDSNWFECQQ